MVKKDTKYYQDKFGNIHGPEIATPICRCMYVNLAEPSEYTPGKPSWGLTLIWDKTDEETTKQWLSFEGKILDVIADHPKASKFDWKVFIRDGDEKVKDDGTPRQEYAGKYFVVLSSSKEIPTIDRNKKFIDPSKIEGGMFVRASAKIVASTPSGTFKVSFKPVAIQLVNDDGVRLGKRDPISVLDDLPMEEGLEDITEDNMFKEIK